MGQLASFADRGIFHFDKVADLDMIGKHRMGAQMIEAAHRHSISDTAVMSIGKLDG